GGRNHLPGARLALAFDRHSYWPFLVGGVPGRIRLYRFSRYRPTRIASPQKSSKGTIIADMVNQSWLGVMTAAKMAIPTTHICQWRSRESLDSTPTAISEIRNNGNSNDRPNAPITSTTKLTYLATVITKNTRVVPAKPSRKFSARGRVTSPNQAPSPN